MPSAQPKNQRFRTVVSPRALSRFATAGLCGALFLSSASCGPVRRPPNILLITLDTTRADHLGAYGSTNALTPSLDQLAADGCVFENAYTAAPITLPAHATLLTGRLPFEHGLRANGENRLAETETTLAERLRARGYQTAAFVGAFVLDSTFGLDQGFDLYDDAIDAPIVTGQNRLLRERPADAVASRAIQWLRNRRGGPWFCWVHFFDPHYPYNARPSVFGKRFEARPYQAEIAYMDVHIGRILDTLRRDGAERHTLVIAVADHGENLGEHGEMQHGLTLYQSAVHVPLIMRWPRRISPHTRVSPAVSIADIAPTILEAARVPLDSSLSGRSLWPDIRQRNNTPRPCYMETHMPYNDYGWAPLVGLVEIPWKFVRAPQSELYNISEDPAEQSNLITQHEPVRDRLAAQLNDMMANARASEAAAVLLSDEQRRALLSLGYAGGHGPAPEMSEWTRLPDVKTMLPLVPISNDAQTLLTRGRAAEALPLAQELVRRDPFNATFQLLLATALGALGRVEETEALLVELLQRGREKLSAENYLEALKLLALCREKQGDRATAERLLREILQQDPEYVEAANGLAWLLATSPTVTDTQAAEALALSRAAVQATRRQDGSFLDTYAAACAAAGDFTQAVAAAQEARAAAAAEARTELAAAIVERLQLYRMGRRHVEVPARPAAETH
jgi:arylsulfatase A-like enzyme